MRAADEISLKEKTIGGFSWMFGGAVFQAVLKVLVLGFLARLISPAEFGLVNAASVVVAFGDIFAQLGVAPALVQQRTLDNTDIVTGWISSLLLGLVFGLACVLAAPWIAGAFNMRELTPVIAVIALIFPIKGASLVPEALLQRQMRFKPIATANLAGYVLGYAIVSVILARLNWGVWALIFGQLVQALITGVLLIRASGKVTWAKPTFDSFRGLMKFGGGLTVSRIGSYVSLNADSFVAARLLGPTMLGYYSRAFYFLQQPTTIFGSLADRVLFPAFASIQTDESRISGALLRVSAMIFMAMAPVAGMMAVFAPELVLGLLGSQWSGAVVPFQCLILALPFRVASKLQGTVLRSLGRVYLQARREWGCAFLIVSGAYLGARGWGVVGLSLGVVIALVLNFFLGAVNIRAVSRLSLRAQVLPLCKPVAYSSVVFGVIAMVREWSSGSPHAGIATGLLAVTSLGASVLLLTFTPQLYGQDGRAFQEILARRLGKISGKVR